jgi:NADPH:quinone reductase-like Zn-dependent oxidoreductase
MTTTTTAWVLREGPEGPPKAGSLELGSFAFEDILPNEALVEPLLGCWEANMTHALMRDPIDICRARKEKAVVVGNAGVVRVLAIGDKVTLVQPGQTCIVFGNAVADEFGYMVKAHAYDAEGTVGVLAKRTKLQEQCLIPIATPSRYSLELLAAFSLRYITAWANWRVAYRCWRTQIDEDERLRPTVWAWGGGVAVAELLLAKHLGCDVVMVTGRPERIRFLETLGIKTIDRRRFDGLVYSERLAADEQGRRRYLSAERSFLSVVSEETAGRGVDIFIDNIGTPVCRATVKALAREGVLASSGWKRGMYLTFLRASDCIHRRLIVNTHYARRREGISALEFAEREGWMAPLESSRVFAWEEIGELGRLHCEDRIDSLFPIFRIN